MYSGRSRQKFIACLRNYFFSRRRRLPMVKHTGPYMVVSGGRTVNITTSIRENELACVYRAYQVPQ